MPAPTRSALPGDLCLLLTPDPSEVDRLQRLQEQVQARLGGTCDAHLHVTVQRFRPPAIPVARIIDFLTANLARLPPLPIVADGLLAFHAAFWQQEVIRWTIAPTTAWQALRDAIAELLRALGCQPHYLGDQPPTCNLLTVPQRPHVDLHSAANVPCHLFTARQIQITQVLPERTFAALGHATLAGSAPAHVEREIDGSGAGERR